MRRTSGRLLLLLSENLIYCVVTTTNTILHLHPPPLSSVMSGKQPSRLMETTAEESAFKLALLVAASSFFFPMMEIASASSVYQCRRTSRSTRAWGRAVRFQRLPSRAYTELWFAPITASMHSTVFVAFISALLFFLINSDGLLPCFFGHVVLLQTRTSDVVWKACFVF